MATANLPTTHAHDPATSAPETCETLLAFTAMAGAIGGAVTGVALVGADAAVLVAVACCTLGTIVGSLVGCTLGRFVVLPACQARSKQPQD
jgi:Na+/glutamate symporter